MQGLNHQVHFRHNGDKALLVEFENEISIGTNRKVLALQYSLEQEPIAGTEELVPAYRSLMVHYDPLLINGNALIEAIDARLDALSSVSLPKALITEIPVLYEGELAQDIEEIARLENKTVEQIIKIHSQSDYFVYMLGFSPGHPYSARFENPFSFKRREEPRLRIPAGSIVVQLNLSDIIPFNQPCGWNIIGNTPILACDFRKEHPFLLRAGQWIKHVPIGKDEYLDIKRQVELGTYVCTTREKED